MELANSVGEDTPLIEETPSRMSVLARRYHTTHKCVSSKAALLILLWSCPVALMYGLGVNNILILFRNFQVTPTVYGTVAFIWSFFPLAGFLADVKFGRYKTVFYSSLGHLNRCIFSFSLTICYSSWFCYFAF